MQSDRREFGKILATTVFAGCLPARALARTDAQIAPAFATLGEAARHIRDGSVSASQLVDAALDRIATYDPMLNAFISVFPDRARAEAAALDAERAQGRLRGPLHGVIISIKDNIDTGGQRTTGGSPVFQMRVPTEDSPSIARLRAAGAIVIGKNNLNELALSDGQQSYYGRVRNPWSLPRATGGSSSGSCAAVAAGLVHAAIGTDTGGSIRNPASWCGVVGLKPTNGLVSNRGTLPLSPSLDTIGPITRSVEDAALLISVMAGYDRLDITSENHLADDYLGPLGKTVRGLRVGRLTGHFDRLEPDVAAAIATAIAVIAGLVDGPIGEVGLPDGGRAMALMPFGETYAVYRQSLAAHRYLFSATDQATLDSLADTKAADFIDAEWDMRRLRRTVDDSFSATDLMVFPTLHVVAPPLVANARPDPNGARGPDSAFDAGLFNILGLPALSVPCGFDRLGLPIGLCIVGKRFGEPQILALAHAYQQATSWHTRHPLLTPGTPVPPIPKTERF